MAYTRSLHQTSRQLAEIHMTFIAECNTSRRAAVGQDSLCEIRGVLLPALRDALPSLDAQAAADALFGAFAKHYQSEQPGDAELVERIGQVQGDALVNLVRAGAVKPADVLPVGLRLLSALAQLCRSNSASLLP